MSRDSKNDDLFSGSTMTFGEHLEELRTCLVRSLVGVLLAFVIVLALGWAEGAVKFIQEPLVSALEDFYIGRAKEAIEEDLAELTAQGAVAPHVDDIFDMVEKDRATPSIMLMDVRGVVDVLGSMYPDTFGQVKLPEVAATDFLDAGAFCRLVNEQRQVDDEASPGKRLWGLLGEGEKAIVEKFAKQPEDTAVSSEDLSLLAAELNRIVADDQFYREKDFESIADTTVKVPVTKNDSLINERNRKLLALLERRKNEGSLTVAQFQRRLLGAAYPDCLAAGPRRANSAPLIVYRNIEDDPRVTPKTLSPQEPFVIWIKAAIVISLIVASPWVFFQVWAFVAAGLYPHEKRSVRFFLPFSLGLFLAGAAVAFFFVFRFVLGFLFWFNDLMDTDPDMRISEWVGFAIMLPIGFGLAFQLPLVMLFLERIGVFTVADYMAKWRVAVLVIFVVAMLLTPADPYSMVLLAGPLVFLYFGGIGLCKYLPKGRNPFDGEEEPA